MSRDRFTYNPDIKTFFWVDAQYYFDNRYAIIEWAEQNDCEIESFVYGWVVVPDDDVALLFRIMWG